MTIWDQRDKCIKMSIKKPMFGPVVLGIASGVFINMVAVFR